MTNSKNQTMFFLFIFIDNVFSSGELRINSAKLIEKSENITAFPNIYILFEGYYFARTVYRISNNFDCE